MRWYQAHELFVFKFLRSWAVTFQCCFLPNVTHQFVCMFVIYEDDSTDL